MTIEVPVRNMMAKEAHESRFRTRLSRVSSNSRTWWVISMFGHTPANYTSNNRAERVMHVLILYALHTNGKAENTFERLWLPLKLAVE